MNSYTRVMNRLQGKPVDRIPNMSIVMMFAARELGVTYSQCCSDYRLLAEAAILCHKRYGIDMVCAISDSLREAEGFAQSIDHLLHRGGTVGGYGCGFLAAASWF